MFLDGLQQQLGPQKGLAVFNDLREANDPETPVSLPGSTRFQPPPRSMAGNVVLDNGNGKVRAVFDAWSGASGLAHWAETTEEAVAVAVTLQTAAGSDDPNSREWLLDLKDIAIQVRDEQSQANNLLQADVPRGATVIPAVSSRRRSPGFIHPVLPSTTVMTKNVAQHQVVAEVHLFARGKADG